MYTLLLILLILDALVLIAAVLMQAAKGGGLAASFGGVSTAADSFIGTRQAGNVLTKIAWWCGGLFLGIAFVLQLMSARTRTPTSILDQGLATPPQAAPAPVTTPPPPSAVPLGPADKGPPPTGSQKK